MTEISEKEMKIIDEHVNRIIQDVKEMFVKFPQISVESKRAMVWKHFHEVSYNDMMPLLLKIHRLIDEYNRVQTYYNKVFDKLKEIENGIYESI